MKKRNSKSLSKSPALSAEFQKIYQLGESLQADIEGYFDKLPKGVPEELSKSMIARAEDLRDRAHSWFNEISIHILPQTTFDRGYANVLLRRISAAINVTIFHEEYTQVHYSFTSRERQRTLIHNVATATNVDGARQEVKRVMAEALRLIRTAKTDSAQAGSARKSTGHSTNTAFILMWMDKTRRELEDVHQTVKEVFGEFGITALRADEIQHQDRITDLILNEIAQSEFLFADLTGERPNVYYEVGYAHALGKRPILYRRANSPPHFDLSIHNVPGYENVTQLRALLRQRLEAIIGRLPKRSADLV